MTTPPENVMIIGSGLGGTCFALCLQQRSIPCTIYEIRPSAGEIGGAISLAPNALRVLDRIGLYFRIRPLGFLHDGMRFVTTSGGVIGDYANGGEERFGYPAMRIKREVLVKEMHRLARERGIEIRFGKKVVDIDEEGLNEEKKGQGVKVRFEDGIEEFVDMVVGFDGIHSAVRRFVCPEIVERYIGFTAIGFSAMRSNIHFPSPDFQLPCFICGPEGSFGMFPSDPEGEEIGCLSTFEMERDLGKEGWAEFARDKAIPWIREVHKDWGEPVQSMLSSLEPSKTHIWPQYDLPPLSTWQSPSHRIIIAGDAAHALSPAGGQGSAQAFEDGALLARALSLISSDLPMDRVLGNWETKRKERVEYVANFTARSNDTRKKVGWWSQKVKEWGMWAYLAYKGQTAAIGLNGYDVDEVVLDD